MSRSRKINIITACLSLSMLSQVFPPLHAYDGSSWDTIYKAVFTDPYGTLPHYHISIDSFGASGNSEENRLRAASRRTLTSGDDLYDFGGPKLLQANGICFAGEWVIDEESSYTGAFSAGSRFPLIARASVALSGTGYADKRAFAMAVKLFPSPDRYMPVKTLNFFVMESLAGKRRQYFLESVLDNDPGYGGLPALGEWRLALRLQNDLQAADRELSPDGPDIAFRPVNHLALIPGNAPGHVRGPKWLRLQITSATPLNKVDDFREELDLNAYPAHRLTWDMAVAEDQQRGKAHAEWRFIGRLIFTESIVSKACDTRLHFSHPTLKYE